MLLRLTLALVLAVTSVHLASMRGAGGMAVAWVEICGDGSGDPLPIDAQGDPVAAHVPCPDCVLAAAVILPPTPEAGPPDATGFELAGTAPALGAPLLRGLAPSARGPPLRA